MRGEWQTIPFGDLTSESAFGPRFSGKDYADNGNIACLRTTDLDDHGRISYQTMPFARLDEAKFQNHFLQKDDLVISRSGTCGITAVFEEFPVPVLPGAFLIRFRLNERAEPKFYRYFFNSTAGREHILSVAAGAVQQNINITNLKGLPVPCPPIETQREIVRILSAYDDLIENNLRRIRIQEEMAQSLYREWFVHFRFPGHESVPLVDSPLGPIPDGWEAGTLGDLVDQGFASLQTGPFGTQLKASDYTDEGTPVINVRNIGFGTLRPEKLEFLPPDKAETHKRHMLQTGDIVFGRKGAVERHLLIGPGEDGWIQGSDCIRLRITGGPITPRMLSVGFREESHQRWMMNQCSSGATMASLNQDILCRIPLTFPPPALVSRFDTFVTAALDHVDNLALKNQALRQTRDLLLPKLLSA